MRIFGSVITVLLLCSCSSLPQGQDLADPVELSKAAQHPPLLFYTERLADQLFHKLQPLESGAIAVTTFADVQLMAPDTSRNSSYNASLQLQESMQTVATQLGYQVSEIRLNDAVLVHTGYENSLGRDLSLLAQNQQARYVITGTLTEGEVYITVNAKLIDLKSQQVLAAASSVIPVDVLWPNEQLQLRHNKLYRNSES
ncbi:FlgO family outer membrane protein [Rheinheimera sp. 1928-s]|uniref:FlgO family outer membrane protein n=1 Tax=Rheinheimera TaxID=67575 RepID=UPI001E3A0F76|nr:FlgO family outer membrane protein [Rheinheimera sp. 1928-s]MDF3125871.1 FlgO family outer membrane protein [Rheinheimera sp. 1928-s]